MPSDFAPIAQTIGTGRNGSMLPEYEQAIRRQYLKLDGLKCWKRWRAARLEKWWFVITETAGLTVRESNALRLYYGVGRSALTLKAGAGQLEIHSSTFNEALKRAERKVDSVIDWLPETTEEYLSAFRF